MITPSYSLAANSRISPTLALNFTTASLDSRITFARTGNTATYINESGTITAINANLPRFDYNPSTLICQGLLIEDSRKNIVLNSLINGTNLATQSVTSTATAYTLSFYGTGDIVLSGTHSATVTGTGAYPTRKTYTFTPTAGTLTLTVSGTVQYAQLEAGAFATSFIPTDSTAGGITRNADIATMTGTNFTNWYNSSEGTFVTECALEGLTGATQPILQINNTGTSAFMMAFQNGFSSNNGTTQDVIFSGFGYPKTAFAYKTNNYCAVFNGGTVNTDTSCTVPTVDRVSIGARPSVGTYLCGWMKTIYYYPMRVINNEVKTLSK